MEKEGGIGFIGVLTIVFIILKLCNVIAWSWWWVLSPLWISCGISLIAILILLLICKKIDDLDLDDEEEDL